MNPGALNLPPSPVVMGIINMTPDSFYDGGSLPTVDEAVARGEQILRDGASLIDIGGESTRPGAAKVSVQEELDRVIPVIEILSKRVAIPISIDTSNPDVMQAAVKAGAKMINDVRALTKPGAAQMAAKLGVAVCLMHMQNDPETMQVAPHYDDVVSEVYQYLEQRIAACVAAGMDSKKIIIDPGFGFGKNLQHNLTLLRGLHLFKNLHHTILIGISNKSMIGQILDVGVEERVFGSVAAAIVAIGKGADIIRAHDVKATVDAIKVYTAIAAP
jgi:dihydropteroate synthase